MMAYRLLKGSLPEVYGRRQQALYKALCEARGDVSTFDRATVRSFLQYLIAKGEISNTLASPIEHAVDIIIKGWIKGGYLEEEPSLPELKEAGSVDYRLRLLMGTG